MTYPDIASALGAKLKATSAITTITSTRIYHLQAKDTTTYPVVVFFPGAEAWENITPRNSKDDIWRVRSTTKQDTGTYANQQGAYTLHQAVYNALHEQALTITGWTNFWMTCEREMKYPENTDGTQFWHFVWDVRIRISED